MKRLLGFAFAAMLLCVPGSSMAQGHSRPMLSFFLVTPGYGAGLGASLSLPIVPNGVADTVNDTLEIEFGADAWSGGLFGYGYGYGYGSGWNLTIPVGVRWTFHLTDKLSLYPKAGVAMWIGPMLVAQVVAAGGIMYRVSSAVTLRAEAGYPFIRAGVGIDL